MGITAIVSAALVGSLGVPTIASVRVQRGPSVLAATSTERVKIVNFAFKPKTLTVSKGTKVKWTNRGSVNHTTTSNKGLWDSGLLAPRETFSRVFKKVGTFMYHCSVHASMVGKIVVS
ncbi:MAG TPA: cupredoxin domain-containing protein [Actinomycetota bacterium]|nr:cupredoxin domain-containing protein [Actinomycetota bacterium]